MDQLAQITAAVDALKPTVWQDGGNFLFRRFVNARAGGGGEGGGNGSIRTAVHHRRRGGYPPPPRTKTEKRWSDPPSGHPGAPELSLGRGPPAAGMGVSTWTPLGQRRGPVPSSVWTRHGAVAQGQSGTTSRGNGRGCGGGEGRPGRGGGGGHEGLRGRWGPPPAEGEGSREGRGVSGERLIGAGRLQTATQPGVMRGHEGGTAHSGPQRVRMSGGERPIGAAKGTQSDTKALCQTPPPPPPPPLFSCWPAPPPLPFRKRGSSSRWRRRLYRSQGAKSPPPPPSRRGDTDHRHRPEEPHGRPRRPKVRRCQRRPKEDVVHRLPGAASSLSTSGPQLLLHFRLLGTPETAGVARPFLPSAHPKDGGVWAVMGGRRRPSSMVVRGCAAVGSHRAHPLGVH